MSAGLAGEGRKQQQQQYEQEDQEEQEEQEQREEEEYELQDELRAGMGGVRAREAWALGRDAIVGARPPLGGHVLQRASVDGVQNHMLVPSVGQININHHHHHQAAIEEAATSKIRRKWRGGMRRVQVTPLNLKGRF